MQLFAKQDYIVSIGSLYEKGYEFYPKYFKTKKSILIRITKPNTFFYYGTQIIYSICIYLLNSCTITDCI